MSGGLSAAVVAVALVAAANRVGVSPDQVFEKVALAPKARIMAASTVWVMGLASANEVERVFRLTSANQVSKSKRLQAGILERDLIAISQQLVDAGLAPRPLEAAAAEVETPRERKAETQPAGQRPQRSMPAPEARRAGRVVSGYVQDDTPTLDRPPAPPKRAGAGRGTRRLAAAIERLKPVTARIVGWVRPYGREHWPDIAELFDVCPDDLAMAMERDGSSGSAIAA